eukprot:TRINITY_DN2264_c2_g1_i1.p1 TRINITY_DN2264_c2_g1~~TRINITY_DN2264_c2_g1_i1.p1  ORF type:complete len:134 (+),score=12.29 TRINITY_DN2264_c2_g1_i1:57-458(+)
MSNKIKLAKERAEEIKKKPFWNSTNNFNQNELEELLDAVFPNQLTRNQYSRSCFHLAHSMELIAKTLSPERKNPVGDTLSFKKCSPEILKNAFLRKGFLLKERGGHFYPNISKRDFSIYIKMLFLGSLNENSI